MRYLDVLGTRDTLGGPGAPVFPFVNLATGQRWCLRPNVGLLPWWVLLPGRGVPGARLRDYAGLLRLRTAGADATVAGTLPHNALYANLIEPLAVSALNTPAASGSARLFWAIVAESLARGGANCVPHFPSEGLSESFVDPAVTRIEALGGQVRTGHRISALKAEQGRVASLTGPEGSLPIGAEDWVVLATPAPIAGSLLPELSVPDAHEAILNLHFKLSVPPGKAGFVGLVGGMAEWVFTKPEVVSVTISAANRLADRPSEELVPAIWAEVCTALDIVAPMPPWRLIREKRATFAATPEQHRRRPQATTGLQNLVLAGDWTDTGLPATIEGAIRSGFAAAHHVIEGRSGA